MKLLQLPRCVRNVKFKYATVDNFPFGVRWIKLVIWSAISSFTEHWVLKQERIQRRVVYFSWPNQPSSGIIHFKQWNVSPLTLNWNSKHEFSKLTMFCYNKEIKQGWSRREWGRYLKTWLIRFCNHFPTISSRSASKCVLIPLEFNRYESFGGRSNLS